MCTRILCKLNYYLPNDELLQLYHALIFSHLAYAIPVWGDSYKTYLRKIVTLQNKAVKIITGTNWNCSANLSYKARVTRG